MLVLSVALGLVTSQVNHDLSRPNIIFILADDIGYGDLSCYGATKVRTPHLDELAATGVKFTDAHSAATVCTPTRYSLMTGEYSFRRKPGAGILSGEAPLSINSDQPTNLAEDDAVDGVSDRGGWQVAFGFGDGQD